jgi:hypothetical protein
VNFQELAKKEIWSPRSEFPPSRELGGGLFTCENGLYLMINRNRGHGDPVRSIGWAESDSWALRVWNNPPFPGGLSAPPEPKWAPPPSLTSFGRPDTLSFKDVVHLEKSRLGPGAATLVTAKYGITDGAFLCLAVNGADGITYFYPSNKPGPNHQPVAIEFKLKARN